MKTFIMALVALLFAAPAFADGVQITSSLDKETVTTDARGVRETKLAPATKVAPGETVIVRLAYRNTGSKPAADVVISNPVPEHLVFTGLRAGAEPLYSVDGGRTFGALDALTVSTNGISTRPARASDVTHVRWRFDRPLAPGASGELAFTARLQ